MKNQKSSDSVSSSVSLFSHKTTDEMMAMDDSEFFDFMERELEDNSFGSPFPEVKEISTVQETDIRQKHSDLEVGESQQKISTSVTHTLSNQLTLDSEISSPLVNPFQSCQVQPRYTIAKTILEGPPTDIIEILDIPLETETERHVGNSFKPDRRIDICANFLKYLKISDFPFSVDQRKTFVIIDHRILGLRANYTRKDELLLKSDLDLLMNLLANTDYHPVSPTRINRYIAYLVSELEFWIVRDPIIPILLPGKIPFFVDPAVYLINKLIKIFPNATEEAIEKSFCEQRKGIHIKLTQLFQTSKFPFTIQQKLLFKELSEAVHATTGNPDSKEEKDFLKILEKLLYDLNCLDDGPRDGISNPKKVKREFNKFVDALIELGHEERSFLNEFELYFLNSSDLIFHITKVLRVSFIPRYTF